MSNLKIDRLQLEIIINNDQARKSLRALEDEAKQIQKELRKAPEGSAEYGRLNARLRANKLQHDKIIQSLGIEKLSMKELTQRQKELNQMLRNMEPGTKEYKDLERQLVSVKNRQAQLRAGMNQTTEAIKGHNFSIKKLAGGLNHYFTLITAGIAALTGIAFTIKEWVSGLVGLDDAIANVMKTTGLTREQVRGLYTDFKNLNTRTPRTELLLLAEQAGRLGLKGTKDIMDFVKVANQIKVALGDDLGGEAEVAIREVGKLTNIYKIGEKYGTDFGQSMMMVGSAINEVSANSQAQAPFLIETLKRLGGVAEQAGIAAQDIIGYGSALDQLGQRQETSATALSKVMLNMFKDVDTYAALAGMATEEFFQLLQTDANEALLQVLEGLNGNNEGLTIMAQKLDGLGLDGSRAVQVLASLSSNIGLVREQQELANKSLEAGTSLTQEYNVKNNNMAGNLEKIGRSLHAYFVNSSANKALEGIVGYFAKWVEVPVADKLRKDRDEINLLVMEITSLNEGSKKRHDLLVQLNKEYPQYLKNVDIDRVSNEELLKVLAKTNTEIIRRIYLEGKKEELADLQENAADKLSAEQDALDKLNALKVHYFKSMTKEQQQTFSYDFDFMMKHYENLYDGTVTGTMKISAWLEKNGLRSAISPGDMVSLNEMYNDWLDAYRQRYRAQEDAQKEFDNINRLSQQFGLNTPTGGSAVAGTGTGVDIEFTPTVGLEKKEAFDPTNLREPLKYEIEFQKMKQETLEKYREENIQATVEAFDKETLLRKTKHQEEMNALGDNEEEKKQLEAQFNAEELQRQLTHLTALKEQIEEILNTGGIEGLGLADAMLTEEEKETLLLQLDELKLKFAELNGEINSIKPAEDSGTDIFGMTPEEWANITNYLNSALSTANQLVNTLSTYYARQSSIEQAELAQFTANQERKKKVYDKQLQSRALSQNDYNKKVEAMDLALSEKKRQIQYEEMKRQRKITLYSAIINAAGAVIAGLNTQPFMPLGIIMGALAAVLGGIQVGLIATEPVPSFAGGNRMDVIGSADGKKYKAKVTNKKHRSGLFGEPTYVPGFGMFGETAEPELVFNPDDTKTLMNTPGIIEAINNTLGVSQFAGGNSREIIKERTTTTFTDPELINFLQKLSAKMDEPWEAKIDPNFQYLTDHREAMQKLEDLESRVNG